MAITKSHPSGSQELKILAVDDDAGGREVLAIALKLFGYRPLIANDAESALKLVEYEPIPFDLIITDHAMPGLSGLDLARKLRDEGYSGEIVVLTGYDGTIEEQEYRRLGIAGVMRKPAKLADLRQWIYCIQECREQSWTGKKPPSRPTSDHLYTPY